MTDLPSRRPMTFSDVFRAVELALGIHTMFETTGGMDGHAGDGVDL